MPRYNGNAWNMSSCNRLVAERIERNRHEKHVCALEGTRGMVDSAKPRAHSHMSSKPKTRKLQEDRAAEIQLENRILLQKMLSIDTKPSAFSSENLAAGQVAPRSLHGLRHRKEMDRITGQNQALLKRLQSAQPSIDPRAWEDDEVDRQVLKFRISQNSCRGRTPALRMPERPMDKLPAIGRRSGVQVDDDWAALSTQALDNRLRDLEQARSGGPPSASARGPDVKA